MDSSQKNSLLTNVILAVVLAVVAFFWIWFFPYLGAKAYWVALITFGVCLAYGSALASSLPYMTIGAVVGVSLGIATYAVYMLWLPLNYGLSIAIAGAIFILIAGLLSIPKLREILPMLLVGWGSFLGAIAQYDYLLLEKPVETLHRALTTWVGVIMSVLFGMLVAALLNALLLAPKKAKAAGASQAPAQPEIMEQ
jgi:hypothetical protein